MLHDSSPQANGLIDSTQLSADTLDERFVAKLQALYVAPEVPQRLKQAGVEQMRLQLAASKRPHARRAVFGLLKAVHTVSLAMKSISDTCQSSNRPVARGRLEGSPRLTTAAAMAVVVLVSLLAVALFAWPAPFRYGVAIEPTPSAVQTSSLAAPRVVLSSIAMVSASDGWAFGGEWSRPTPGSTSGTGPPSTYLHSTCLVLHYNGIAWSRHQSSACVEATGISMLSANEGWAVGDNTILHYTRGDWHVDTTYGPSRKSVRLESMAMVSPDEGWAVGSADTHALVLHYAHGHWAPVGVAGLASDSVSALRGIAMVSAQEGWAVGSEPQPPSSEETTLLLHYTKGQWTRVAWSIVGSLNGVAAFPSGDVWVVGEDNVPAGSPGLVVHLRQGVPIKEDRPTPSLLEDIAMVSSGEGWAVGGGAATVHYHDGVWTREGLTIHQFALMRVSLVSATEGWAVGSSLVDPPPDPNASATLFHLSGGIWQVYPLSRV